MRFATSRIEIVCVKPAIGSSTSASDSKCDSLCFVTASVPVVPFEQSIDSDTPTFLAFGDQIAAALLEVVAQRIEPVGVVGEADLLFQRLAVAETRRHLILAALKRRYLGRDAHLRRQQRTNRQTNRAATFSWPASVRGSCGFGKRRRVRQSTIAGYTNVFSWPRKLNVADGMNCVIRITTSSSTGSTQKIVLAAPPHAYSPFEPIVAVRAGTELIEKPRPKP